MDFHPEKVFFKSDTQDPFTDLPIYVFDSTYFPNLANTSLDKKTCDSIIVKCFKKIIPRIPKSPYSLVCFSSGFKNVSNHSNSWITMLQCYKLLPEKLRSNLRKVFVVHESWLIRSFTQILNNVLQIKVFKSNLVSGESYDKLTYCKNLTELSKLLDITKIRISLDVYTYDLQFDEKLIIPYTVKHQSYDYQNYKKLIFERVSQRLTTEGVETELVMTKPGKQQKVSILIDAIDRMNYLDISQWDIYCMGSVFLHLLRTSQTALIPIEQIPLPVHDDYEYTVQTFNKITEDNESFETLVWVLDISLIIISNEQSKHDIKSITKTLMPALSQEKVSLKTNDKLSVGQRFLKNLLLNWEKIQTELYPDSKPEKQPKAPDSRKVSTTFVIKRTDKARELPEIPQTRKTSGSSTISVESSSSSVAPILSSPESSSLSYIKSSSLAGPRIKSVNQERNDRAERDELKVLSDATSSLNKQKQPSAKKEMRHVVKFSDGYSSIEGQKKVNKLAQLYEERIKGIQILNEIEQ